MDATTQQSQSPDEEINLLDYWRIIWKRRWLIGRLCVVSVLTAMVLSVLMPKIYASSTTFWLPALDSKEGGGLGGLLAAAGGGGAAQSPGISLPGAPATPTDVFMSMLKSRIMADEVIRQFDLQTVYEAKTMQDGRKALEGNTKIAVSKEKVITITVEAELPQLAADIANFYVTHLDRLNRTLNVTKAGQTRVFLERRLAETKINLVREEEALKEFQIKNRAVALEPQAQAMMQAAAMVQAQIYAMLISQYEQAKLAEARDTPTVQVLDPAIPAEKKSKPRIGLNMMIAGVLALVVGVVLAFALEYVGRVRAQQKEPLTSEIEA